MLFRLPNSCGESNLGIPARASQDVQRQGEWVRAVEIWGTGSRRNEFLYVDDLADSLAYIMKTYSDELHLNVSTGEDIAIKDLALLIKGGGWV